MKSAEQAEILDGRNLREDDYRVLYSDAPFVPIFFASARDDSEDEPTQQNAQSLLSFFSHKETSSKRPPHRFFYERKLETVTSL